MHPADPGRRRFSAEKTVVGKQFMRSSLYFAHHVVELASGCWGWAGPKEKRDGRALFRFQGRKCYTYRWIWECCHGPVPEGRELDHVCKHPWCVNPDHLEAVTHRVNVLRGVGPTAQNARKTYCPKGHRLSPESGRRICKTCRRIRRSTPEYRERDNARRRTEDYRAKRRARSHQ